MLQKSGVHQVELGSLSSENPIIDKVLHICAMVKVVAFFGGGV